ncbi:MAG: hypothetical protein HYV61_08950 [Candidatus Rokubacteria bacterium]|nr:hypothetical protein [Candidatus Rokubacteria bacterium]
MGEPLSEEAWYVLVVGRGRENLYLALKGRLEDPGQVQVVWDRRVADRRVRERRTNARDEVDGQRKRDRRRAGLLGSVVAFVLGRETPDSDPPPEA